MDPVDLVNSPPNEHPALALTSDYMRHPGNLVDPCNLVMSSGNAHPALALTSDYKIHHLLTLFRSHCSTIFLQIL